MSATVIFTMQAAAPLQVYYVHPDQIGSPRAITRSADNRLVWQWRNEEAFGDNEADEDPMNTGTRFVYNLRFPGQVYDPETKTNQNYFRDYRPNEGRYDQSDLIGLWGGISTYLFAGANPLSFTDPLGLWVYGTYNRTTGVLSLHDLEKGTSINGKFESGGHPFGDPIPNGIFDILARGGRDGFFRLEPNDSKYGNDTDERTGRTHFRLHHPGRTLGCIAATDEDNWKAIENLLIALPRIL